MYRTLMRSRARGATLVVMLALASFADEKGLCYPSLRSIERRARVTRKTVVAAIRELVASGELAMIDRGHVDRDRIKDRRRRGGFQATHYYQVMVVDWVNHLGGVSAPSKVVESTASTPRRSYLLNKSLNTSAPKGGALSLSEGLQSLYTTAARAELKKEPDADVERLARMVEVWARRRGLTKQREHSLELVGRAAQSALREVANTAVAAPQERVS